MNVLQTSTGAFSRQEGGGALGKWGDHVEEYLAHWVKGYFNT